MKTDTHYKPFAREHSLFREVMTGKKDLRIDMAKISDLASGDDPEDIAEEVYEAEIASQGQHKEFIVVNEPQLIDGMWTIKKHLTPVGQAVYESLEGGVLWDYKKNAGDLEATYEFYEDMMKRGSMDMRFAELVIGNKSEDLRALRGKLVYFKMQGQRKGDKITNLD